MCGNNEIHVQSEHKGRSLAIVPNHSVVDVANAQLIATAPELLEALIRLKAMYTDLESTLYDHNLTVNNWHLNGDTAPIDNFFEDLDLGAIENAEKVVAKALGKEADDE